MTDLWILAACVGVVLAVCCYLWGYVRGFQAADGMHRSFLHRQNDVLTGGR